LWLLRAVSSVPLIGTLRGLFDLVVSTVTPLERERRNVMSFWRKSMSDHSSASCSPARAPECAANKMSTRSSSRAEATSRAMSEAAAAIVAPSTVRQPRPGDFAMLTPNVVSVPHWDRLLGGLLYAATPRIDWATLLRRSFAVDVLECPRCHGRLRVLAVITERAAARRVLAHLGVPTDYPPLARARDPTGAVYDDEPDCQLELGLA
jgi:hypothetical protein